MQLQTLAFGLSVWIPVVIARIRDPTKTETPPLQVPLRPPTPLSVPPGPALFSVPCLTRTPHYTTIEDLIECLDGYTVPAGAFSQSTYILAQPQDPGVVHGEQWSWTVAISNLLYGDYNCGPSVIPDAIRPYYRVDRFTEASGKSFCILSGKHYLVPGGYFQKGWGTVVVPATEEAVSRWIHISAPHPGRGAGSDEGTPKYAAAAFKNTGAKSLLVAGRHRDALPYSDTVHACVEGGEHYSKTDSAHDNEQPFYDAQKQIRLWQEWRGCETDRCAYVQIHRKYRCSAVDAFLSAGLGTGNDSADWYHDNYSPVKWIRDEMRTAFPGKNISIPPDMVLPRDDECHQLTATDNIFGRLLNGRTEAQVCHLQGYASTATGQFVHIEQTGDMISSANYANFARAINRAIRTTCTPPKHWDPTTLLCV